ncbi:hypothetical protein GQX74_002266 [Glossina fuscipes]|nr:hypothetical protein GQX74_002266 [Glossina fuscipes]
MFKFKILWIFCYLLPMVWSDCILQFPHNMEYVPEWKTEIGKRWFKIPYITRGLLMKEGETFEGHCPTKFNFEENPRCSYSTEFDDCSETSSPSDIETLTVTCDGGLLGYNNNIISPHTTLRCNDVEWSISQWETMEISESESWCRDKHQIFTLSTKNLKPNRTLAYICYDLNEFSLQAVKYKTVHHQVNNWNTKLMPITLSSLPATSPLSNEVKFLNPSFLHIQNELLQDQLEYISDANAWLKLANYEYGSIIQSGPYLRYFKQYNELLDILWWHNLRITNWQRFLNAFEEHTKTENTYDVYMGTLDVVKIPSWSNPNEMEYLELEFFNYNDVAFCRDICDEIDWLKDVRSTFHYANFGFIFCCNLDSLKDSPYVQKLPHRLTSRRLLYQKENVSVPSQASRIENIKTNFKFKALEGLNRIKEFLRKKE